MRRDAVGDQLGQSWLVQKRDFAQIKTIENFLKAIKVATINVYLGAAGNTPIFRLLNRNDTVSQIIEWEWHLEL